MRVKFLFWNIRRGRGSRLAGCLSRLASQGIDVFLFAESHADRNSVVAALNAQPANPYSAVESESERVRFFARQNGPLGGAVWRDRYFDAVSDRITALECQPQGALSVLIIGAHLVSPANASADGRAEWAREVAADIQTIERDVGHTRTVLVGDLNMNPFDGGVVQTTALHAVMTRGLTDVVVRHQARTGFPVFYNPMWSCFGDRPASRLQPRGRRRTPGTYYFDNTTDRANTFWQMFDQVLLRPPLMEKLTHLEILASDGTEDFVTAEGKPRQDLISDHLPILFELNL
jgi:exonuclease III